MGEVRLITNASWWRYYYAMRFSKAEDEFGALTWRYIDDKYCTISPLTDEQYLRWCILYE